MDVHARAVVTHNGLRHERCSFTVLVCYVVYHVLEFLGLVCATHQTVKASAYFALTSGCYLMMVNLDRDADFLQY